MRRFLANLYRRWFYLNIRPLVLMVHFAILSILLGTIDTLGWDFSWITDWKSVKDVGVLIIAIPLVSLLMNGWIKKWPVPIHPISIIVFTGFILSIIGSLTGTFLYWLFPIALGFALITMIYFKLRPLRLDEMTDWEKEVYENFITRGWKGKV